MNRSTFLRLAVLAFGLVFCTFLVRGTTRLVLGDRLSMVLAFPIAVVALVLVAALFVTAVLDLTGVRPVEDDLR